MITDRDEERIRRWFTGRLPKEWHSAGDTHVTVDREEITVLLTLDDVGVDEADEAVEAGHAERAEAGDAERAEARAGKAKAFREDTRSHRMQIAREAQHRFGRKVSWAVRVGDREELFTHVSAPVMTRLRQPQRLVLDTLIDAGVARSRAEALAWCVRLVGQHEEQWLGELREAMTHVADVRAKGPAA